MLFSMVMKSMVVIHILTGWCNDAIVMEYASNHTYLFWQLIRHIKFADYVALDSSREVAGIAPLTFPHWSYKFNSEGCKPVVLQRDHRISTQAIVCSLTDLKTIDEPVYSINNIYCQSFSDQLSISCESDSGQEEDGGC